MKDGLVVRVTRATLENIFVVEQISPFLTYPIKLVGIPDAFMEEELTKYSIKEEEILWD